MGNIGSFRRHVDITSGAREHQANKQQIAAELSVNTFSVTRLLSACLLFASKRADGDVIFDLGDAGSGPSGVHRFLVFSARAGGAAQACHSMGYVRLDMTAVDKGVASQGCFDGSFDVSQTHGGLNDDFIADARDPVQGTQRAASSFCCCRSTLPERVTHPSAT